MKLFGEPRAGQADEAQRRTSLARPRAHAPVDRVQADAENLRGFATRYQAIRLAQQLPAPTRELGSRGPHHSVRRGMLGHDLYTKCTSSATVWVAK